MENARKINPAQRVDAKRCFTPSSARRIQFKLPVIITNLAMDKSTIESHLCRGVRFGRRSISSSGSASISLVCANPYFSSKASSNVGMAMNSSSLSLRYFSVSMSQYHIYVLSLPRSVFLVAKDSCSLDPNCN